MCKKSPRPAVNTIQSVVLLLLIWQRVWLHSAVRMSCVSSYQISYKAQLLSITKNARTFPWKYELSFSVPWTNSKLGICTLNCNSFSDLNCCVVLIAVNSADYSAFVMCKCIDRSLHQYIVHGSLKIYCLDSNARIQLSSLPLPFKIYFILYWFS